MGDTVEVRTRDDDSSPDATPSRAPDRAGDDQPAGHSETRQLGSAEADVARAWRRCLRPHIDQLAQVIDPFDTVSGERLRAILRAALDCTDDGLLPLIVECEAVLYPAVERVSRDGAGARRMLRVDERVITELRHELRGRLAGDLDDHARAAIRERLYALQLVLRSHVTKHDELLAAVSAEADATAADAVESDLTFGSTTTTACSNEHGACGCGHQPTTDEQQGDR